VFEVVFAAFSVGLAVALIALVIEVKVKKWITLGKTKTIWAAIGGLIFIAILCVIAGSYLDSLHIHFEPKAITVTPPFENLTPQLGGRSNIGSLFEVTTAFAFMSVAFSLSRASDLGLEEFIPTQRKDAFSLSSRLFAHQATQFAEMVLIAVVFLSFKLTIGHSRAELLNDLRFQRLPRLFILSSFAMLTMRLNHIKDEKESSAVLTDVVMFAVSYCFGAFGD
jgi:hypothetical protein